MCYTLPHFDARYRTKFTKDGRPWESWTTSTRKHFGGMQKKAYCGCSFKFMNLDFQEILSERKLSVA